jgi:hypothetical protein
MEDDGREVGWLEGIYWMLVRKMMKGMNKNGWFEGDSVDFQ